MFFVLEMERIFLEDFDGIIRKYKELFIVVNIEKTNEIGLELFII